MNHQLFRRILTMHSLFWIAAMFLPFVVLVLLDRLDVATPARVALYGSLALIVPFQLANFFLSRKLSPLVDGGAKRP